MSLKYSPRELEVQENLSVEWLIITYIYSNNTGFFNKKITEDLCLYVSK